MTTTRWATTALLACAAGLFAGSAALAWTDEAFDQYFQRKDTVTLSAGNAQEANTVTHVIDPRPRRARNTRIPGNGERMTHVIERYRNPPRPTPGQPSIININNPPSPGASTTGQ